MSQFRAACIQNTASRDVAANIAWVCARIDDAVAGGAEFIALAETVGLIEPVNAQIPASFSKLCLHITHHCYSMSLIFEGFFCVIMNKQ